jgi:hypothetical protein
MRLYLDDDMASSLLVRLLLASGHDVAIPLDLGISGQSDCVHLTNAIRHSRILLTGNHDDFERLHDLVIESGGHHPGIFVVRRDNNPKRDLTARGIVTAINKIAAAGIDLVDACHVLNDWR